jgi:hypothetical protein
MDPSSRSREEETVDNQRELQDITSVLVESRCKWLRLAAAAGLLPFLAACDAFNDDDNG